MLKKHNNQAQANFIFYTFLNVTLKKTRERDKANYFETNWVLKKRDKAVLFVKEKG